MGAAVKGSSEESFRCENALYLGPPGSASRSISCCGTVLMFLQEDTFEEKQLQGHGISLTIIA